MLMLFYVLKCSDALQKYLQRPSPPKESSTDPQVSSLSEPSAGEVTSRITPSTPSTATNETQPKDTEHAAGVKEQLTQPALILHYRLQTLYPSQQVLISMISVRGGPIDPADWPTLSDNRVRTELVTCKLPPHRPWDCAIELRSGATLPHGRIYPLSQTEKEAMNSYIDGALSQGAIRPSTSLAASSFFFLKKKDGGLHPCIDYRGGTAIEGACTIR
ncbi:hypothetical protein DPEC_G00178190 [Dallia pectoralis]|uniref:Uncharacterized protein n=1 Tax=Dallia pectoralis TaxID=75939 RepID=A0ACC2GF37_DALPE|nr:hypothetical protein DPEC_G00178190 [Dallia pectoralis]